MKKKILYSLDCDIDDLYCTILLISLHLQNKIDILGFILEDGFFSYPKNFYYLNCLLSYFPNLKKVIPIFKSHPRNKNLLYRDYPTTLINIQKNEIDQIICFKKENLENLENLKNLDDLNNLLSKEKDDSIDLLTTGNLTTINHFFLKYPKSFHKIKKVVSMIGNYKVQGNLIYDNKNYETFYANSEYNAYLDPKSFQSFIQIAKEKLWICPLDVTNYIHLNEKRINYFKKEIENRKKYFGKQENIISELFLTFLEIGKSELENEKKNMNENEKIYMWDAVACILLLDQNIKSSYIQIPIYIDNFGKIHKNDDQNIDNFKTNIYTFIDSQQFNKKLINFILPIPIFKPFLIYFILILFILFYIYLSFKT